MTTESIPVRVLKLDGSCYDDVITPDSFGIQALTGKLENGTGHLLTFTEMGGDGFMAVTRAEWDALADAADPRAMLASWGRALKSDWITVQALHVCYHNHDYGRDDPWYTRGMKAVRSFFASGAKEETPQ